ncbi:unnamed protein product [Enterobius vermicularis]|uniref:Neur_chan_LBD domain-containing protein n=1 Tax=Enterobius vermicularis TaxID=51028 RepID=A0A0N4V074_ENTVE|nr:unnamed protein product [Enterobius vermicularis]
MSRENVSGIFLFEKVVASSFLSAPLKMPLKYKVKQLRIDFLMTNISTVFETTTMKLIIMMMIASVMDIDDVDDDRVNDGDDGNNDDDKDSDIDNDDDRSIYQIL